MGVELWESDGCFIQNTGVIVTKSTDRPMGNISIEWLFEFQLRLCYDYHTLMSCWTSSDGGCSSPGKLPAFNRP